MDKMPELLQISGIQWPRINTTLSLKVASNSSERVTVDPNSDRLMTH
jgi:hypothetical protein